MGQSAADIVAPVQEAHGCGGSALAVRLATARRDGWHLDEGWRARADGSRFWGTCMISAVMPPPDEAGDAGATWFLMVVRDTTELRRSTEDLRRALTRDHLTDGSTAAPSSIAPRRK